MRVLAVAVSFVLLASSAWADPQGEYEVEGTNPGSGSGYTGTVRVSKTGATYSVVWTVGGTRYVGTGIGNKNFIAVSYRSGNSTGLALYSQASGGWQGVWTYAGSREVGTERWTPR